MRAVALLGPHAQEQQVRQFALPDVSIFSGNELDVTDEPGAVLIFGGDGTLHRHLGALAAKKIPVLVVPLGSANDFARSMGIGSVDRALTAWQRFCRSRDNLRTIDLGTIQPPSAISAGETTAESVSWQDETLESLHFVPSGPRPDLPQMGAGIMQSQLHRRSDAERAIARTTFFASIAGTGLDAAVNRITSTQPRWLRAHGGYALALLKVLAGFRPPHITVTAEVEGHWQTRMDEPGFLVAAGNGPQYGHGMRLTHQAQMDDGLLDVCFVRPLSKLKLVRLFHVVYRGGHIGMKEVEYFRASRVSLATDPVTEVFADGEYICTTPVEIGLRRDALSVIAAI